VLHLRECARNLRLTVKCHFEGSELKKVLLLLLQNNIEANNYIK
jgi:hypothetical protein